MEYLIVHRGGGRGRCVQYELHYDVRGAAGDRRLIGLVDIDQLNPPSGGKANKSGGNGKKSALKGK